MARTQAIYYRDRRGVEPVGVFTEGLSSKAGAISKLENGDHIPTIPVLERILAVLDEELLIGMERRLPHEEVERELAPLPELAGA